MYIQVYSDTNFRILLEGLEDRFGDSMDIIIDESHSHIHVPDELLEDPFFGELVQGLGVDVSYD